MRVVTSLYAWTFFRARGIAAENVPAGPVIIAPNHFSFMDTSSSARSPGGAVNFMAKSQLFTRPMQWIYTHGGVFPVRRGYRDEDAFITANEILERGGLIVMYCEGGRSRTGSLRAARARHRPAGAQSGATVVPAAIHGSSKVRNWKRLQFPKVTVQYGEPMRWEAVEDPTTDQQQQVTTDLRPIAASTRASTRWAARASRAAARGAPGRPPLPRTA